MDVNWRWHGRYRGLLPLSPHALGENGRLLLVRPDELEARKYQILQLDSGGEGSEDAGAAPRQATAGAAPVAATAASVNVETVHQLCLTAAAPLMIGVTDDDLYLFRDGRKSRFMPERRVTYLSVALARDGGYFTAAFTDMMFAGQTLALADAGGKVVWTKDLDAPIVAVAISPEGRAVAAGLENGTVLAFDASRSLLWEAALESAPVALALSEEGKRCVIATTAGTVMAMDRGDAAWRAELAPGVAWSLGAIITTCDGRGALTAVAGSGDGGWVVLLDADGRAVWEQGTTARVTGAALSPSGRLLALSQSDGELLLFDLAADARGMNAGALSTEEEFARAMAAEAAQRHAEAREALRRVLEAAPGHVAACEALIALDRAILARALEETDRCLGERRFAAALEALHVAGAVTPFAEELPGRWLQIVAGAAAHTAGEAAGAEAAGDLEGAIGHWRALAGLDPEQLHARQEIQRLNALLAQRLTEQGEAALAAGREAEAEDAWRRAQAAAPCESVARRLRELETGRLLHAGIALYGQQRFPEAAFQFRKLLALQPDHPEALRYLSYISGAGPQSPLSERFSRLE